MLLGVPGIGDFRTRSPSRSQVGSFSPGREFIRREDFALPSGTLFVLNFAGATAIGLGLLAPVERLLGRRGGAAAALLALGGIGLAATAFAALLISERTPLFGFMEPGYDPPALMTSRVAPGKESAAAGVGKRVRSNANETRRFTQ